MEALRDQGHLMFVDSRTTARTVAADAARDLELPVLSRDVFIDNEAGRDYARRQFTSLIERAKLRGTALAIAHPHPDTLAVLEANLAQLSAHGVQLVRLTRLYELRQRRPTTWQLSSSHWHPDVKSWKR